MTRELSNEAIDAWRRNIRNDTLAAYQYEMGLAIRKEGNLPAAADRFRLAIDILPGMAEAHFRLVQSLREMGATAEAEDAGRRALAVDPCYVTTAKFRIGRDHYRNGRYDSAEATFGALLEDAPDHVDALAYRALAMLELGRAKEAEGILRGALAKLRPGDVEIAGDLLDAGRGCFTRGQPGIAHALIDAAASVAQDDLDLRIHRAMALAGIGRLDEASALYQQSARLSHHSDDLLARDLERLGHGLLHAGKLRESEWAFRRSLELRPDSPVLHTYLGAALLRQRRLDDAAAEFDAALRVDPKAPWTLSQRALLLLGQSRSEEAIASARAAYNADGHSAATARTLGRVLQYAGRIEEAAERLAEASRAGSNSHWNLADLGLAHLALGRPDQAEEALRAGLAHLPQAARMSGNLGLVLHAQGRLAEAEAAHRQAVAGDGAGAWEKSGLGLFLHATDRDEEASRLLAEAVDDAPWDAWPLVNLGLFHLDRGEMEAASRALRRAIEVEPEVIRFQVRLRPWAEAVLRAALDRLGFKADF